MAKQSDTKMEDIIALTKRRGFIYQGSEIYGGLAGAWDYGPLGVALKNNIKRLWWKRFVDNREDMYGVDAALLMKDLVWIASGHVAGFHDPLVDDLKTGKRYRADHLLEESGVSVNGVSIEEMSEIIKEKGIKSPEGNPLGSVKRFNMLFPVKIGATEDGSIAYLRGETAQGMFVNYKNIIDSFHPKLPFGMAQIGKAFRNEIAPRDFIFRTREFEQMEIEYFINPKDWEKYFEEFRKETHEFIKEVGITESGVHELEVSDTDRAFYSKRTIDFEFDFPFGKKELYGLAYRTDFDLKSHSSKSGVSLDYLDDESHEKFVPHVIEPSFGVDRTVMAVLASAYREDEMNGEKRVYMSFKPAVAPVKVAVFPLLKNKPDLVKKAREIFAPLKKALGAVMFDDNGNVGKRYRRQDEIGTPFCITVDFDSLEGKGVTVRSRDTGEQVRILDNELLSYLETKLSE